MRFEDYTLTVTPLPEDDGGGRLVLIPDLPGCMADGGTSEEAIDEARDVFAAWAMAEREDGHDLPRPKPAAGSSSSASRRACTCNWPGGPLSRASA